MEAFKLGIYLVDDLHELYVFGPEHPAHSMFLGLDEDASVLLDDYFLKLPFDFLYLSNNGHIAEYLFEPEQIHRFVIVLYGGQVMI